MRSPYLRSPLRSHSRYCTGTTLLSAVIAGFGIGTGAWNACDGVKLVRNTTIAVATLVVRKFIMIFLRLLQRVGPRLFTHSLLSEIWDSPVLRPKRIR
ncbi:conserved exported hypothetical protein [Agrobacterium tumefaciens str. Kerr 14]|uniref:Uncharacterized protein n=1 Tax=Agrobacterium tumefaciens str. Kerr 14 TaxID=1183424 RepID=A0A1S7PZX1_AGRTU|nr:conserved exported hypothetical protein [Agrobacterium tumefaciens str. CFBP 5621]CUX29234.1 conserved exported hypothetical protein [Agrobacterium tumefaciens str. Kerr 14]